jgi:hypothetical protein
MRDRIRRSIRRRPPFTAQLCEEQGHLPNHRAWGYAYPLGTDVFALPRCRCGHVAWCPTVVGK